MKKVTDFAPLLFEPPVGRRAMGGHTPQPVLMRAMPGTGKTWSMLQFHHHVAKTELEKGAASFVPILVRVQRLVHFWKKGEKKHENLLLAYIEHEYGGTPHFDVLMQAYHMRKLVVFIDGVDEAAGLKEQIEEFIVYVLVPMNIQAFVTSPEGEAQLYRDGGRYQPCQADRRAGAQRRTRSSETTPSSSPPVCGDPHDAEPIWPERPPPAKELRRWRVQRAQPPGARGEQDSQ